MSLSFLIPGPGLPCAFLFGGTGGGEIGLIFVVLLLLFGPRKLPEVARMIGKILAQLRSASNDFKDQLMRIEEEEPQQAPPPVDVDSNEVPEAEGEEPADDSRTPG